MSTPHSKKQRKIPRKVAPLLVGLTAVCFLCFVILSFSIPKPSPFQLAASEEGNALKWARPTPPTTPCSPPRRTVPVWLGRLWISPFAPWKNI